jgi:hypothetical protein
MRASNKAAIFFPLLTAACGSGAGPDYSRSYATLHGSIVASSVQTTSQVRVALVWEHVNTRPGVTALKSTQELGLHAQFPANFQMDINALPPKEALSQMDPAKAVQAGIDPNLRMAAGTLVVYEDTNDNGKLDLLTVDSESTIDRVLGVPTGLTLLYVEGTPPPVNMQGYFAGLTLQRGFNLLQEPGWQAGAPAGPLSSAAWQLVPLSTEIAISLTASPQLSRYVCEKNPGLIDECAVTPPSDPAVPTPTLSPNCGGAPASGSTPTPTPTPGGMNGGSNTGAPPVPGTKPLDGDSNGGAPAGGINGAGQENCSPDTAALPCSQAACIFKAPAAGATSGGGAGASGAAPGPAP